MRDIQRYSPVGDGVAKTDINGMLVAYGEYRVLETHYDMAKAEVERLKAELSNITGWGRGLESDLSWARAELLMVNAEAEKQSKQAAYICASEETKEEISRLKAEVERLTNQNALATPRHLIASQDIKTLREQIEELKLENSQYEEHHKYGQNVITSLREEVERLTAFTTRTIIPNEELQAENARLKAEVERLTKAIDLTIIDLDERHERQDLRAWEFAELLRKAKGVQS